VKVREAGHGLVEDRDGVETYLYLGSEGARGRTWPGGGWRWGRGPGASSPPPAWSASPHTAPGQCTGTGCQPPDTTHAPNCGSLTLQTMHCVTVIL